MNFFISNAKVFPLNFFLKIFSFNFFSPKFLHSLQIFSLKNSLKHLYKKRQKITTKGKKQNGRNVDRRDVSLRSPVARHVAGGQVLGYPQHFLPIPIS